MRKLVSKKLRSRDEKLQKEEEEKQEREMINNKRILKDHFKF